MEISKVALEYARRFKHLEQGRDVFFRNFYSVLDHLEGILVKRLKEHGIKVIKTDQSKPKEKKDFWKELYIRKSYAATWNKLNKDKNEKEDVSGIGLEFVTTGTDSKFAFCPYLFFYHTDQDLWENANDLKQRLALPALRDTRVWDDGKWFYAGVSSIGIERQAEFNVQSFLRATESLPPAFLTVDKSLAALVQSVET